MKQFLPLIALTATGTATVPVLADAKIACNGGPMAQWAHMDKLKSKLTTEGWKIKKILKAGDCYEVYAKTPQGDNVESFFNPRTFQKILVLKRGKTLYRADGF